MYNQNSGQENPGKCFSNCCHLFRGGGGSKKICIWGQSVEEVATRMINSAALTLFCGQSYQESGRKELLWEGQNVGRDWPGGWGSLRDQDQRRKQDPDKRCTWFDPQAPRRTYLTTWIQTWRRTGHQRLYTSWIFASINVVAEREGEGAIASTDRNAPHYTGRKSEFTPSPAAKLQYQWITDNRRPLTIAPIVSSTNLRGMMMTLRRRCEKFPRR